MLLWSWFAAPEGTWLISGPFTPGAEAPEKTEDVILGYALTAAELSACFKFQK